MRPRLAGRVLVTLSAVMVLTTTDEARAELDLGGRAGIARIVEPHVSASVATRWSHGWFYLQPEWLALRAGDHTDAGPVLQAGIRRPGDRRIAPYAGIGKGPVDGPPRDRGLVFVCAGATLRPDGRRLVVRPEVRLGLLGESEYLDAGVAVAFGVRGRKGP
jgi:hypothetical protein